MGGSTKQALLQALSAAEGAYISGQQLAEALGVSRAAVHKAAQALSAQALGRHKMLAVRGSAEQFAALEDAGLEVEPMNLQNVFVALCGHGDEEA